MKGEQQLGTKDCILPDSNSAKLHFPPMASDWDIKFGIVSVTEKKGLWGVGPSIVHWD